MRPLAKAAAVGALVLSLVGCGQVEDYGEAVGAETTLGSGNVVSDPDETSTDESSTDASSTDASDEPEGEQPDGGEGSSSTTDDTSAPDESTQDDPDSGNGNEPDDAGEGEPDGDEPSSGGVVELEVGLTATFPHDSLAFTQGLTVIDGTIIESTGLYGSSSRRRVGLTNGEVSTIVALDESLFGAGLTVVDETTVIQLTWREGVAIVSDVVTLQEFAQFNYSGEGWGLCHDGEQLVMSDGSSTLTLRDPMSFAQSGTIQVTRNGDPVENLNELECVDGDIWANVWLTNEIVRIDAATGNVTGVADLTDLVPPGPLGEEDVLNGIAHDPATGKFYVTGKNWDVLYEVTFTER